MILYKVTQVTEKHELYMNIILTCIIQNYSLIIIGPNMNILYKILYKCSKLNEQSIINLINLELFFNKKIEGLTFLQHTNKNEDENIERNLKVNGKILFFIWFLISYLRSCFVIWKSVVNMFKLCLMTRTNNR